MDEREIMVREDQAPLTKKDLLAQVQIIQDVMKGVMRLGEHYGTVPGCGDKPTLLKPGAEKLMMTFRLAPDPDVLPLYPGDDDKIGYRVTCRLNAIQTGRFMGAGVGECSSEEDKYKWRAAVCEEEYQEADPGDRRVKYYKGGGSTKQVRTNPHDQANTVLKMAKKRALVDAVLTVLSASDLFTQDIEEMEHIERSSSHAQASKPSATKGPNRWICGVLTKFEVKQGQSGKRQWVRRSFGFNCDGEQIEVGCFDLPDGWTDVAVEQYKSQEMLFQWKYNDRKYKELIALSAQEVDGEDTGPPSSEEDMDQAESKWLDFLQYFQDDPERTAVMNAVAKRLSIERIDDLAAKDCESFMLTCWDELKRQAKGKKK